MIPVQVKQYLSLKLKNLNFLKKNNNFHFFWKQLLEFSALVSRRRIIYCFFD